MERENWQLDQTITAGDKSPEIELITSLARKWQLAAKLSSSFAKSINITPMSRFIEMLSVSVSPLTQFIIVDISLSNLNTRSWKSTFHSWIFLKIKAVWWPWCCVRWAEVEWPIRSQYSWKWPIRSQYWYERGFICRRGVWHLVVSTLSRAVITSWELGLGHNRGERGDGWWYSGELTHMDTRV